MAPRVDDDDDIRGILRKSDPDVQYPRDLKTATRAEYVTGVRKNKKGPGCPLFGGSILAIIIVLINIIF